jgi:tRNA-(ms[2]io[6]A)-hydroxylase
MLKMTRATECRPVDAALTEPVCSFLCCETPGEWLAEALNHPEELLIDHANCEKKAAATAMKLMYRYTDNATLLSKMSQLAREELLHFQQVVELMRERGIKYTQIAPSRYAAGLRKHISYSESLALVDTLLIGAYIEARSCERFAMLAQVLDPELSKFYRNLLRSEARHFQDYLTLAYETGHAEVDARLEFFGQVEKDLILAPDETFRFHSGTPLASALG